MCHVSAGEVVAVHHGLQLVDGCVDEESRVCTAADTPNDVRGLPIIPVCRLFDHAGALSGRGDIGADEVESLGIWRHGGFLVYAVVRLRSSDN